MFPAIGSTIIQAISFGNALNSVSYRTEIIEWAVRVSFAKASGTPGELGSPSVSAPDPV